MANVYAWPPVGITGHEWTVHQPVARSRSLITGATRVSSAQRARRLVTLQVSALAAGRSGAGYMERLKELLEGGVHLVRLTRGPINWWLDEGRLPDYRSEPMSWTHNGASLDWAQGFGNSALVWFSGNVITARRVTSGGRPAVRLSGLPPNTTIVRPMDLLTIHSFDGIDSQVVRAITAATTNGSGVATILLAEAITILALNDDGRANLGGVETRVFEVEGELPRAVQPVRGDWSYSWQFREVFADERGPFVEIYPWT